MVLFIVWNEDKTEGYATTDHQLAYEARKSADTNCYMENGERAKLAISFCEHYYMDDCTVQMVELPGELKSGT